MYRLGENQMEKNLRNFLNCIIFDREIPVQEIYPKNQGLIVLILKCSDIQSHEYYFYLFDTLKATSTFINRGVWINNN